MSFERETLWPALDNHHALCQIERDRVCAVLREHGAGEVETACALWELETVQANARSEFVRLLKWLHGERVIGD